MAGHKKHLWAKHPAVRTGAELTFGERAADRMRNSFGSWTFIGATFGFLGLWMAYNGHHGFDPYPWILLNLILSCFAAMQGAIILLAAKRADKISSELAEHDYQVNVASLRYHVVQSSVLARVAEHAGVQLSEQERAALLAPSPIPLPPIEAAS
jgi:uncharacterized membrane protein